jgi:hypothetical protein
MSNSFRFVLFLNSLKIILSTLRVTLPFAVCSNMAAEVWQPCVISPLSFTSGSFLAGCNIAHACVINRSSNGACVSRYRYNTSWYRLHSIRYESRYSGGEMLRRERKLRFWLVVIICHKDYKIGELQNWDAQQTSILGKALPTFSVQF